MKKTAFSLVLFLLAALLLLPACNDSLQTEKLFLEEKIPFHQSEDNGYSILLDIDFPTAGFSREVIDRLRRSIRIATLGEIYADFEGTLAELAEEYRSTRNEDYVVSNESMLEDMEMDEKEAPFLNWGTDIRGSFGESWGDWVVYQIENYEYRGGAHGIGTETPVVFDKNSGNAVSWRQVVPGVSDEKIIRLINAHKYDSMQDMIQDAGVEKEDIFYVNPIEPSDSFRVGEDGLTFCYQPYDVAAYVFGVITITVPWEELR